MFPRPWLTQAIVGAAICAFFFYCTGFGLYVPLGFDDVMNLSFAWEPPWLELGAALINPFTPFYRPTGSLWYRVMFEFFGLDPFPYRIAGYGLLILNLFLVYRLTARLTRSKEVGAMASLLFVFHGRLAPIYLNNGTVYDVLCATFSLATILLYVRWRAEDRDLSIRQRCVILVLFILALNAKEMAAFLPLVLFSYEVAYAPSGTRSRRWLVQHLGTLAIGIAIVAASAVAKMSERSVMHGNPPYMATFTISQFVDHWRSLLTDLLYVKGHGLTPLQVGLFWMCLFGLAALSGRRHVWFSVAFCFLGPIAILFFPFRGFFVMYLPNVGWCMLLATLLVRGREWLCGTLPRRQPLPANPFEPERLILFAVVAIMMLRIARHDDISAAALNTHDVGQDIISWTTTDILDLNEPLPKKAKVLLLRDRFPRDAYGPQMMMRLLYNDRDLVVDRPSMMTSSPDQLSYDRVLDYVDRRLTVVGRHVRRSGAKPTFLPQ
jgi:hypothetical protein